MGTRLGLLRRGAALVGAALLTAGCAAGAAGARSSGLPVLHLALSSAPSSVDPALASDASTFEVLAALDEGLVRIGSGGAVTPGIASSWSVGDSGTTYTFHLRANAKWSDGSSVTAQDFVYAWQRAVNPGTASPYASDFALIAGTAPLLAPLPPTSDPSARAAALAKVPSELRQIGVQATNAATLVVHLTAPAPYWLDLVALPAFAPVESSTVQKDGTSFGTKANLATYDGPFELASWIPGSAMDMVKNPYYWQASSISLGGLDFTIVASASTQVNMFDANQLSLLEVPSSYLSTFSNKPGFQQVTGNDSGFLVANVKQGPLANADLRCALSEAVDRTAFATEALNGAAKPAPSIVPPGAQPQAGGYDVPAADLQSLTANIPAAKADVQAALAALGVSKLPTLRLLEPAIATVEQQAQALIAMWAAAGIPVQGVPLDPSTLIGDASGGQFDLLLFGWNADYPDPMTFLSLFEPGNPFNFGGYQNAQYDQLLTEAGTATGTARGADLAQAEGRLLASCAAIPLTWDLNAYITAPGLKGVVADPFGAPFDFRWASLSTSGKSS